MAKFKKKDYVAVGIAKRAEEKIAINNGDITSLTIAIQNLQIQMAGALEDLDNKELVIASMSQDIEDLNIAISTANSEIEALSLAYSSHTHGYTDIDQSGTIQNKTTSTP
jgi:chromosome segregation ATPase